MLTKRAGIDNALLDDIMDEAAKGNGPGGMADTLQRKHCKRWQEKEAKWLAFLKRRKLSPAPYDPIDFVGYEIFDTGNGSIRGRSRCSLSRCG